MSGGGRLFGKPRLGKQKTEEKSGAAGLAARYQLTPNVLGAGSYAQVVQAIDRRSHEAVAVKIIDKTNMKEKELRKLYKEVEILKTLDHPNVVKLYDWFDEPNKVYIVMELVPSGELFQKIVSEENEYNESDVKVIIRTLAQALKYCKEKGVIHRDIKPENILLTEPKEGHSIGEIKLADFNLSIQVDADQTEFSILQTMCGTPNYVAPEVLSGQPYDYKCDIWSLGVICYLLLSGGYLPFYVDAEGEEGRAQLLKKVKKGNWDFTPDIAWASVSKIAKDFVRNVMNKDPQKRFNYEQLLTHEWLRVSDKREFVENSSLKSVNSVPAIQARQLKEYNLKRKLLAVNMVETAVDMFRILMDGSDGSLAGLVDNDPGTATSFLGSGMVGFDNV